MYYHETLGRSGSDSMARVLDEVRAILAAERYVLAEVHRALGGMADPTPPDMERVRHTICSVLCNLKTARDMLLPI